MRGWNKAYNNEVVASLHFRASCLSDCVDSVGGWYLMLHIATSKGFMEWQNYPRNRKSIRIRQPETLDSKRCPTVPGMGGCIFSIFLHTSLYLFKFCSAKGFN